MSWLVSPAIKSPKSKNLDGHVKITVRIVLAHTPCQLLIRGAADATCKANVRLRRVASHERYSL